MFDNVIFRNQPRQPNGPGVLVKKFVIFETGTYNKQYRRPYTTDWNLSSMKMIEERLQNQQKFVPALIGGVASNFVAPAATFESIAPIEGVGWDERRLRWMMLVEYRYPTGGSVEEVLLGYTDRLGVTPNGHFDPDMRFIINMTMQVRSHIERSPMGNITRTNVGESTHLISNNGWNGVYNTPVAETRLRPADMFAIMSRHHIDLGPNTFDTRSTNMGNVVRSRRSNGNPANYVTAIMENYKNAYHATTDHEDLQKLYGAARGFCEEASASQDKFLTAIKEVRGEDNIRNFFQWADVERLSDGLTHVTKVQLLSPQARMQVHQAGQTADWADRGRGPVVATIIGQSLPAILLEFGITKAAISATNNVFGAQHTVVIANVDSFSNANLAPYMEAIKARIVSEVLNDVSFNNEISYEIQMQIDVMGESFIRLNIDGEWLDYVIPSFSDALMAPIMTTDGNRIQTLSNDFMALMNQVIEPGQLSHNFDGGMQQQNPMSLMM